jgi:hypothetical protein
VLTDIAQATGSRFYLATTAANQVDLFKIILQVKVLTNTTPSGVNLTDITQPAIYSK